VHAATLAGPSGRVGILASPAVRRIGLFDAPIQAAGLTPVYAADQDALLSAIRSIKADGATAPARRALEAASADLLGQGAQVQMVACTEFSIISDAVAPGARAFDTLDQLADAIIAFSSGGKTGTTKAGLQPLTTDAQAPN
jgi:aspartate racemase